MSNGKSSTTPVMKIVGLVLLCLGVIWLLLALQMDVTAPGTRVVNIGRLEDRSNQLLLGGLVTLIGVVLFGFGSLRSLQGRGGADAAAAVSATPPCERDLALEPYKVWLVARYAITRNEVLGAFVCHDKLFPSVDEALVHAHQLEMQALQDRAAQAEAAAAARAAAAEAAQRADAERRDQRQAWVAANKPLLIGAAVVVFAGVAWAATASVMSWRANKAAIASVTADIERLTGEAATATAAAQSATKAYTTLHGEARKALLDAEIARLDITLLRGAYGLQYDARIRNGSQYHLGGLRGRLRLFAGGVELPIDSDFRCCDNAEDRNGFDMGYDIEPGGSARKEYAILSIHYQVSTPEVRKFVSDNRIPTVTGLIGTSEIRLDGKALFAGEASFVTAPVREEQGGRTVYKTQPVDFDAMAAARPDVAALKPAMDAANARASELEAALTVAREKLESLKR